MTILILAQQFFPDSVGGSARVAYEQARELSRRGHTVIAVIPKVTKSAHEVETLEGISLYRYGDGTPHFLGQSFTDRTQTASLLQRVLAEYAIDVILAHQPTVGFVATRSAPTIKLVYVFHASVPQEIKFQGLTGKGRGWKRLFFWAFIRWMKKMEQDVVERAHTILVLSEYSKKLCTQLYGEERLLPIKKIATGIDTSIFSPPDSKKAVRSRIGIPEDVMMFLTVRRLVPRMGLPFLIDAIAPLIERHQNIRLYIVGEGPLYNALDAQIHRLNLQDNVILTGRVRQIDLPLWYQSADCFILSTRAYEGLGIATLEALSSGVPVLGTPVGATEEILNKVDSRLLFKSAEIKDIRKGIEWFLNEGSTIDFLSTRGRALVESKYTWENAGAELEFALTSKEN